MVFELHMLILIDGIKRKSVLFADEAMIEVMKVRKEESHSILFFCFSLHSRASLEGFLLVLVRVVCS